MTTTLHYLHDFQLWYPHGYDSGLGERDRTPTATPTGRATVGGGAGGGRGHHTTGRSPVGDRAIVRDTPHSETPRHNTGGDVGLGNYDAL